MLATVLYSLFLLPFVLSNPISLKNPVYIITNAKRPSFGRPGLSPVGLQRASECIPSVFANISFGVILVCTPDTDNIGCMAANTTAAPLAANLGLVPDTSCGTGDDSDDCVPNLLVKYTKKLNNTQSMLIVWDANEMDDLLENLQWELPDDDDDNGDDDPEVTSNDLPLYADIILVKNVSTDTTLAVTSMNCTGLDGEAPGTF